MRLPMLVAQFNCGFINPMRFSEAVVNAVFTLPDRAGTCAYAVNSLPPRILGEFTRWVGFLNKRIPQLFMKLFWPIAGDLSNTSAYEVIVNMKFPAWIRLAIWN